MKIYKAWAGKNKDSCMFKLFKTKKEAQDFITEAKALPLKEANSGIERVNGAVCRCGKLMFAEQRECLKCEDLRLDAMYELADYDRFEGDSE